MPYLWLRGASSRPFTRDPSSLLFLVACMSSPIESSERQSLRLSTYRNYVIFRLLIVFLHSFVPAYLDRIDTDQIL